MFHSFHIVKISPVIQFLAQDVALPQVMRRKMPRRTAATEHGQQPPLLQSTTAMSGNVVFVNIDWKEAMMHRRLNANMKKLATTITDVVQKMNPRVLCMVEVGLAEYPLSEAQMQQVADEAMRAWRDAATEHVELSSMFTAGAPYITIFVCGAFQCSDHRILHKLYDADGRPRTAQAFVLSAPGGDSIDIINVHAPSGTGRKQLKDPQR